MIVGFWLLATLSDDLVFMFYDDLGDWVRVRSLDVLWRATYRLCTLEIYVYIFSQPNQGNKSE